MDSWVWMVLGLLVAVGGASFWLKRFRAANGQAFAAEVTPERAQAAAARLSEPQHRAVYRYLASDQLLAAAQAVKAATGASARDSLLDAQALRAFPQVWTAPATGADTAGISESSAVHAAEAAPDLEQAAQASSSVEPDQEAVLPDLDAADQLPSSDPAASEASDWVIPTEWEDAYGGEHPGELHMELTHHDGDELKRFSTQDLSGAERDQFMSQLRDEDFAGAGELIAGRLGMDAEAVEAALRANHESGKDKPQGISLRFDLGDGNAVNFSTQDLPEDERADFLGALEVSDLVTAAQIISRHTGISPEQALGMLETFRHGRG